MRRALIVKIKKNDTGEVTDVMLDNGKVYSIDEAISMSESGFIEDIIIKQGQNKREYYRDSPTNRGNDSFDHLPLF